MSYRLDSGNRVQHIVTGVWIPARYEDGSAVVLDETSLDARGFVAWVNAGYTPEPPLP